MHRFWVRLERLWNENRFLAWFLILSGIAIALWTSFYPKSPGVSIGLLGLAAGIMSVRPKMHSAEKFGWVTLLITFAILEVLAISRADKANEDSRIRLNQEFNTIAEGLKTSISNSKTQYDNTIQHVDGVLDNTQKVQNLSKQNLEFLTGGNSFPYVIPAIDIPLESPRSVRRTRDTGFNLILTSQGRNALLGIRISVAAVLYEFPDGQVTTDGGQLQMIEAGNAMPHHKRIVPNYGLAPSNSPDPQNLGYLVTIDSQNGTYYERLWLKPDSNVDGWDYKINIWKGDMTMRSKPIKLINWTKPVKQQLAVRPKSIVGSMKLTHTRNP